MEKENKERSNEGDWIGMYGKKTAHIKKWGNGTGILLPKVILDMLSIKTDDLVDVSIKDQSIVISPVKKKRITLAERFANYEGETKQEEYWTDTATGKEVF